MLRRKIEVLRKKMIKLAMAKGSFVNSEVMAISQELDKLLNDYHKMIRIAT